ncbi:MAG: DUF3606 domain-containing protein [Polyangiales bacterium]
MADNPNLRGSPDNDLISLKQAHEVSYWTKKFGVSERQLRDAIDKVGHSVSKVTAHFASRR